MKSKTGREIVAYVVREGKVRGKGRYLMGCIPKIRARWGSRHEAFRYMPQVPPIKDSKDSGGRIVRIVKRAKASPIVDRLATNWREELAQARAEGEAAGRAAERTTILDIIACMSGIAEMQAGLRYIVDRIRARGSLPASKPATEREGQAWSEGYAQRIVDERDGVPLPASEHAVGIRDGWLIVNGARIAMSGGDIDDIVAVRLRAALAKVKS